MTSPPLLSICLPTFNHAELLECGLAHLMEARRPYADRIEVVVADNASTDRTPDVVKRWAGERNFRYVRRPANITGNGNIVNTPRECATGEFAWVLGDDDAVLPGSLPYLLDFLEQNRDLDYFVLNYVHGPYAECRRLCATNPPAYDPPAGSLACVDQRVIRHDSLARVLESTDGNFQFPTHVAGQVFRTQRWRETRLQNEGFSLTAPFRTLDDTFPHLMLLFAGSRGRPVYYCGRPLAFASLGAQEWSRPMWFPFFYRCHELRTQWRNAGVSPDQLRQMHRHWIEQWTGDLHRFWFLEAGPGIGPRLLAKFIWRSLPEPRTLARRVLPLLARKLKRTLLGPPRLVSAT